MLVKINGAAVQGIDAISVMIEVSVDKGFGFCIVGLPDTAVKESDQRILSAVKVSGIDFPRRQVVINMSPADIKKEGSSYDLPLAIGILAADEKIKSDNINRYMMMGELSLDGTVLPIKGVLPMAIKAREEGLERLRDAMTRLNMSARAYDRILRVARTIADLDGSEKVEMPYIQEAIGYRNLDRASWAGTYDTFSK